MSMAQRSGSGWSLELRPLLKDSVVAKALPAPTFSPFGRDLNPPGKTLLIVR